MCPIYEYQCEECKGISERYLPMDADSPLCCGLPMSRRPTFPVMVKIKGEGGYPSRRKFFKGTSPGATTNVHPWLSYDPNDTSYDQLGQKVKTEG